MAYGLLANNDTVYVPMQKCFINLNICKHLSIFQIKILLYESIQANQLKIVTMNVVN